MVCLLGAEMQSCLCAYSHAVSQLLGRHLVTVSPSMVSPLSFPQHPITPRLILHFAPYCLAPALLIKQEKTVLCCQSFCRACGYVFALMMATVCGSYAQRDCGLMGWKGEKRDCHGLRYQTPDRRRSEVV